MATASSTARSVTRRVFEVESRGNVYSSPTEAPEILRYGKDGSFTRIGLVPQGTTGEDYQAMVPLALHYERGLDVFYVVTRGRNHRPDVYELSHLP
jgi:hypothetical protein